MMFTRFLRAFVFTFIFCSCSNDDDMITDDNPPDNFLAPNVTMIALSNDAQSLLEISIDGTSSEVSTINLTDQLGITPADLANNNETILTWFRQTTPNFKIWRRDLISKSTTVLEDVCNIENEQPFFVLGSASQFAFFSQSEVGQNAFANIRISEDGSNCNQLQFKNAGIISTHLENDNFWLLLRDSGNSNVLQLQRYDTGNASLQATATLTEPNAAITQIGDDLYIFFSDRYHIYNAMTLSLTTVVPYTPEVGRIPENGFFETQLNENALLVRLAAIQPSPFTEWPGQINLTTGELLTNRNLGIVINEAINQVSGYEGVQLSFFDVDLSHNIIAYGFSDGNDTNGIVFTNFDAEILQIIDTPAAPSQVYITSF